VRKSISASYSSVEVEELLTVLLTYPSCEVPSNYALSIMTHVSPVPLSNLNSLNDASLKPIEKEQLSEAPQELSP
jgi:hypothetical protein